MTESINKTILVVGATGMLGQPVARRLQADGWRVRVFTHSPDKARAMFASGGFEIATGNVEDAASLARAIDGCHGVHVNLFGGSDPDLERRGAVNIAAAAVRAGTQRVTLLSGSTAREENAGFVGTAAKLAAEQALRASGVPYTIFRASSFMESLPKYVRGNSASLIGTQPHPWRWLAAADYARMVSRAYATPDAANKTLYALGPEAITLREALTRYCSLAHPGVGIRAMPLWAARAMATVFRIKDLAEALPYIRYFETVRETGDATEANALLGAPTTTLAEWSRQQPAG